MAETVVTTSTTEKSSTVAGAPVTDIKRERHATVRSSPSDRLTAWNVRDFVKAMNAAGVPDKALIDVSRSHDTMGPTGLAVQFSVTLEEDDDVT